MSDARQGNRSAGVAGSPARPSSELGCDELFDIIKGSTNDPELLRRLPRLAGDAFRLVWAAGPRELLISVALKVAGGLGLAVVLLLGRGVLAGVLDADQTGTSASTAGVLPRLVVLTGIIAILGFVATLGRETSTLLGTRTQRHAQGRIIDVACAVELDAYETPAFHDRLLRASLGGQARPMQLVDGLLGLLGATIGILGVTAALLALQPWLVPLVLLAAVPLLASAAKAGEVLFGFHRRQTAAERQRGYLYNLLTSKDPAKEIRAFDLAGFLRDRYERLYDTHLAEQRVTAHKRLRILAGGTLGMATALAATIAALLWLALDQRLSLAEAGTAAGAVLVLGERLMTSVSSAGMLYESARFLEDFTTFVAVEPTITARRPDGPAPNGFARLRAEDLSFTYPSADRPALQNVSLEIGAGEIVALVGPNGSGKTTLAKLLCRLYLPQAGRILWDGTDTAGVDPDQLRRQVAVIFQDFQHYALPARDNIGLGRHQHIDDLDGIMLAARHAGADGFLAALPGGYDTILGPEFSGGNDLSIGQWQRIALARAFFRDAPFIILDEPTAALDARAEHDLFQAIRILCRGRSVLLISHRFSSVRTADRIYVLHHGRIVQHGSHDQLMATGGLYADLFTLQAAAYLDQDSPPANLRPRSNPDSDRVDDEHDRHSLA
jgi:ATP-binding cassette subfamily B protein